MTRPGAPEPAHPLGAESTSTGPAYSEEPHVRYWGDRGCSCTFAYIDLGFWPHYHDEPRVWAGYGWVLKSRHPDCPAHNDLDAAQKRGKPGKGRR